MVLEIEVKDMPEWTVAYVRHTGPYAGDEALFGKLIGKLMQWAGPRGLIKPDESKMLFVYHDDPEITDESKLRTSVLLTVPPARLLNVSVLKPCAAVQSHPAKSIR